MNNDDAQKTIQMLKDSIRILGETTDSALCRLQYQKPVIDAAKEIVAIHERKSKSAKDFVPPLKRLIAAMQAMNEPVSN